MIPKELDSAIKKAINDGKKPVFVNATAGTTVLGAFDDFNEIAEVCQKYGLWMHVDVSVQVFKIYCSFFLILIFFD